MTMSSEALFCGIDVGTTACKIGVYDSKGKLHAMASEEYDVKIPEPSFAEQHPLDWWKAIESSFQKISSSTLNKVTSVSLSAQSPVVVPVNENAEPLYNALLWFDHRATKEVDELKELGELAGSPTFPLPKIQWFLRNKMKPYKFLDTTAFINYKLTGKFASDHYDALLAGYEIGREKWKNEIFDRIDFSEINLPEVYQAGECIGRISADAAESLGLPRETVIVMGGIDGIIGTIGAGLIKSGMSYEVTGSSSVAVSVSKTKIPFSKNFPPLPHLVKGYWLVGATMSTTGSIYRWFRDNFGQLESIAAKRLDESPYDLLSEEASKAEAGSGNLVILPYFSGERSPIWDEKARGTIVGLSLKHERKHFIRAILESVGYAIRHNLEIIESKGIDVKELRVGGGGAKSDLWNQIKADIICLPVLSLAENNVSVFGAAILAGFGSGAFRNLKRAIEEMVNIRKRYQPSIKNKQTYDKLFEVYKKAYISLKKLYSELIKI